MLRELLRLSPGVVLKQNGRRQEKLVAAVFAAYAQGDVKPITGGLLNSTAPFTPFHVGVCFGSPSYM
jgi:hypothetical protein